MTEDQGPLWGDLEAKGDRPPPSSPSWPPPEAAALSASLALARMGAAEAGCPWCGSPRGHRRCPSLGGNKVPPAGRWPEAGEMRALVLARAPGWGRPEAEALGLADPWAVPWLPPPPRRMAEGIQRGDRRLRAAGWAYQLIGDPSVPAATLARMAVELQDPWASRLLWEACMAVDDVEAAREASGACLGLNWRQWSPEHHAWADTAVPGQEWARAWLGEPGPLRLRLEAAGVCKREDER